MMNSAKIKERLWQPLGLITLLSVIGYAVLLWVVGPETRDQAYIAVSVPVVMTTWLLGWRIGFAAIAVGLVFNAVVESSTKSDVPFSLAIRDGVVGFLILFLVTVVVGYLQVLRERLKGELVQRQEAEASLQKAHDELDTQVMARTTELRQEVMDRQRAQAESSYRANLETLVANLSSGSINLSLEELGRGIDQALQAIGEFTEVDRSYIFEFRQDGLTMDNTHEWCAAGIAPQIQGLQGVPLTAFPWLMQQLNALETIHIPQVSKLPPEANAEQKEFQSEGIQSLIVAPLVLQGTAVGFVGFDSVRRETPWSAENALLLRVVSNMLVNALEHKRAEEERANRTQELEETLEKLRLTQAQLVQADKLASIGTLVSGVAHEVNNPLTGALGFTDLVLRHPPDQETKERLEVVHNEIKRAVEIMRNLLSFAREHHADKSPVSVNEILENTLALRSYEFKVNNLTVKADLQAGIRSVVVDPHQLQQVFMNLIVNAEQAMAEMERPGELTVATHQIDHKVLISIADNGSGIPKKYVNRIFDPFFTTKPVGKGTGLGLSICYGIVQEHGGSISVDSAEGKGTTFTKNCPWRRRAFSKHGAEGIGRSVIGGACSLYGNIPFFLDNKRPAMA